MYPGFQGYKAEWDSLLMTKVTAETHPVNAMLLARYPGLAQGGMRAQGSACHLGEEVMLRLSVKDKLYITT